MNEALVVSSILIWVVLLFNLFLTLALIRRVNSGSLTKDGLKAGQKAPTFAAETLTGEMITSAHYAGRPVAFLFISPTCGPCREALPSYEALSIKARSVGVEMVLVSTGDVVQTKALAEEFKISLPVLSAPQESNSFKDDYNVSGTPSYCFVNAQGKVQSAGYPSLDWGGWKELAETWEKHGLKLGTLVPNEGR